MKFKYLNINWFADYVKYEKITQDQMKDKIQKLDKDKHVNTKTQFNDWLKDGSWLYERKGDHGILYINENNQYKRYSTNVLDDNKNTQDITGIKAIQLLEDKFKEMNKVSLKVAFGTTEEKFKLNIPRQFYFVKENYKNRIIDGISSLDFSSHYPSCGCGILPDSHTAKEYDGFVEPTEEYPFAFYDSGHIAVYKELDTHKWLLDIDLAPYMLQDEVLNSISKKTILMKASKYTMDDVWKYFYNKRKENELFKLVLNASIGFFHTKRYTMRKYAHIAAVIIARANNKMYKLIKLVGYRNIMHVCVDGLIYKGKYSYGYGEGLGSLKQEFLNKSIYIKGCNQYVISELNDYNNCLEIKHGGFDARVDNKPIDYAEEIHDIDKYYKLDKSILQDPSKILEYLED